MVSTFAGPDSVMLVPIDIDEDGRMDILVQKSGKTFSMDLIYNNMFYDSYFIKVMMLSQD
jgi:hypothetical protein